ncbi:MAG TPA: SDR family oxidoreductase [Solirubrobacteraceae bacterium]|jgi:NAD(P)-dependent dehydrogenase (short-subunit alcohol dehydrogenase family)|nr:SDR family oxidoreductase [Solirubrobacteraceae bacterium]
MTATTAAASTHRDPELLGQTVVVIGGSSGVGLATARRARADGASVILTGLHDDDALQRAAGDLDALSTAAFDANDPAELERFFAGLPKGVDHVMVTAGGPHYGRLLELTADELRHALSDHLLLAIEAARNAAGRVRPGGTLLFMSPERGKPAVGSGAELTVAAAIPELIANLALELAPVRINLIAAGFIDTPLSASLLGGDLEKRRDQLRATLPIGRVVAAADVAALAVHIMSNTALTGATYNIDGGQRLV